MSAPVAGTGASKHENAYLVLLNDQELAPHPNEQHTTQEHSFVSLLDASTYRPPFVAAGSFVGTDQPAASEDQCIADKAYHSTDALVVEWEDFLDFADESGELWDYEIESENEDEEQQEVSSSDIHSDDACAQEEKDRSTDDVTTKALGIVLKICVGLVLGSVFAEVLDGPFKLKHRYAQWLIDLKNLDWEGYLKARAEMELPW